MISLLPTYSNDGVFFAFLLTIVPVAAVVTAGVYFSIAMLILGK
jgi:hypothetical protein